MSLNIIANVEKGVYDFNVWIKDIKYELQFSDNDAYVALKSTLHALRDILAVEEVTKLGAQLPLIIKGVYYDEWVFSRNFEKDELTFISDVHAQFNNDPAIDPNKVILAVFYVLQKNITEGKIDDIKSILPPEVGRLFDLAAQKEG